MRIRATNLVIIIISCEPKRCPPRKEQTMMRSLNKISNNAVGSYQMKMTRCIHKFADGMNGEGNIRTCDSEKNETSNHLPI